MPAISVYLPTHNRMDLVSSAIESVMAQTFTDWELIVVDDASRDGTPDLLRRMSALDERIVLFRNDKAQGAPRARNRAISASRGTFVTGLDDDDSFHPKRLQALFDFWHILDGTGEPVSGIYTQERWLDRGNVVFTTKKSGSASHDDLVDSNPVGNQIFAPRRHFLDIGMFDENLPAWQDLELFMRMTRRFGPARLLDMPLYGFDVSANPDRISRVEQKIRKAYAMVCEKHFPDDRRKRQRLVFQLFSPFYGFCPRAGDIFAFARLGVWPSGMVKLMRRWRLKAAGVWPLSWFC